MKKGMNCQIFEDPITRKKKEGVAKLLHKIGEHWGPEYKLEVWEVKFPKEKLTQMRTIREDIKNNFSTDYALTEVANG